MALLAGVGAIGGDLNLLIQFIVAILALIVAVFAWQAKHWWWIPVMLAIAVAWTPVYPFDIAGPWWVGAQYVAILLFVLAGVFIKVPYKAEDARG